MVAGGGVAGLEALLALRALAGDRVALHLISPGDEFVYRPLEVLEPFDSRAMVRIPWARLLDDLRVSHTSSALREVDIDGGRARTTTAQHVTFDLLVVATGAETQPAKAGAITVGALGATDRLRRMLDRMRAGSVKTVAFVVPPGSTWTLPIYELALLTARFAREAGSEAELLLVTAETTPLEVFGSKAGEMVRDLLTASSIRLSTVDLDEDAEVPWLKLPAGVRPDAIVSMPRLLGPGIEGLRTDPEGFLPVDEHGLVVGETDVYAAGDAVSFPVKQGGLATQQADALAAHIARRAGADVEFHAFEPMLRGMLLTGEAPRYLRTALTAAASEPELSEESPWWPPVKIVGRYLAPYLAQRVGWATGARSG